MAHGMEDKKNALKYSEELLLKIEPYWFNIDIPTDDIEKQFGVPKRTIWNRLGPRCRTPDDRERLMQRALRRVPDDVWDQVKHQWRFQLGVPRHEIVKLAGVCESLLYRKLGPRLAQPAVERRAPSMPKFSWDLTED